jgi:hypothetical protein
MKNLTIAGLIIFYACSLGVAYRIGQHHPTGVSFGLSGEIVPLEKFHDFVGEYVSCEQEKYGADMVVRVDLLLNRKQFDIILRNQEFYGTLQVVDLPSHLCGVPLLNP